MKKIITISALTAGLLVGSSAYAAATAICTPATAAGAASTVLVPESGTVGTNYMLRAISPKCSANTHVAGMDGTGGAWYAIGAVSVKGKNSFKGQSNGGSVSASAACTVSGGCTLTEAQNARDAANTDATPAAAGSGSGT